MERMLMDCCVGCRNYQKCKVCRFEDDVACTKWKLEWFFYRIGKIFRRNRA